MSVRDVERAIVAAAADVLENRKLRLKDCLEWRTAPITQRDGEVVVQVEALDVTMWAAFPASTDKRKARPEGA